MFTSLCTIRLKLFVPSILPNNWLDWNAKRERKRSGVGHGSAIALRRRYEKGNKRRTQRGSVPSDAIGVWHK